MNAIRAVFVFALVLASSMTEATVIIGSGGASCGTWTGDRQRNESRSQINQAWVLGFVAGYTIYKPPQDSMPKPVDARSVMLWIDNYCDANPNMDISDAAKALIEDLTGRSAR